MKRGANDVATDNYGYRTEMESGREMAERKERSKGKRRRWGSWLPVEKEERDGGSAFVAARKQIRRGLREKEGVHRERERERESGDKRAAGNKRLANPSCQFNLASNPGEMLIRASLPFLPPPHPPRASLDVSLSARFASLSRFRGLLRVAHARTRPREPATTLYFRAKIPPPRRAAPPRRPRGNCVQSELHPPFFFLLCLLVAVSLPRPPHQAIPFGLPPS